MYGIFYTLQFILCVKFILIFPLRALVSHKDFVHKEYSFSKSLNCVSRFAIKQNQKKTQTNNMPINELDNVPKIIGNIKR